MMHLTCWLTAVFTSWTVPQLSPPNLFPEIAAEVFLVGIEPDLEKVRVPERIGKEDAWLASFLGALPSKRMTRAPGHDKNTVFQMRHLSATFCFRFLVGPYGLG
jgi:hypothetical protein